MPVRGGSPLLRQTIVLAQLSIFSADRVRFRDYKYLGGGLLLYLFRQPLHQIWVSAYAEGRLQLGIHVPPDTQLVRVFPLYSDGPHRNPVFARGEQSPRTGPERSSIRYVQD